MHDASPLHCGPLSPAGLGASGLVIQGITAEAVGIRKRIDTLRARAAICGIAMEAVEDDQGDLTFIASIGATTLPFRRLDDVERWLSGLEAIRQPSKGLAA